MVPWLHITGGDVLLFENIRPTSAGAIAAASIVLASIAIFERWVSAVRGILEDKWRMKCAFHKLLPCYLE